MCGIVGYIGDGTRSVDELVEALRRLEYRGYDSAGIAMRDENGKLLYKRAKGRIDSLADKLPKGVMARSYISHTRWATHGKPSEQNAHPHSDCAKKIFVVHNGIIENYRELGDALSKKGHEMRTETDTEVIPHLIEEEMKGGVSFPEAVHRAVAHLKGAYAIIALSKDEDTLVATRLGSPLILGIGKNMEVGAGEGERAREFFLASDPTALLSFTRDVIYIDENERVEITPTTYKITGADRKVVPHEHVTLEWSEEDAGKGGYAHFMQKEIHEAGEAVQNATRGRMLPKVGAAKLGGLESVNGKLREKERIIITACGTAFYAGLSGKYMLEEHAGIPTEVELASELRYRKPVFTKGTALLAVSQSGETADTLAAVKEAKRKGVMTLGIVNKVGTAIPRETEAGVYNHAGPEIAVASTKAYISQLTVFALLSVYLGRERDLSLKEGKEIITELEDLPKKIAKVFEEDKNIKKIARAWAKYDNMYLLGRKYSYPVALEGALKLKEIAYVHAEGYAAGEMKHGPMALITKDLPCIFVVPNDSVYEKTVSNIEEVKARGGRVLAIATEGDKKIAKLVDEVIYIPKTLELLSPILSVIPLQLFAYHIAVLRGCDVDKPRNIAKTVTVE